MLSIPSRNTRIATLVFFSFALGCGPSRSTPTSPSATSPPVVESSGIQSEAKAAAVEGSTTPSNNSPILDTASNSTEQAAPSGSVVSKASEPTPKEPTPVVTSAQEIPPVTSKPAAMQPTAEQLARWAQPEQEPIQLLACRDWSKTGFVEKLASFPDGRMFLLAGTKITLWSIDGTEPEHVFLDLATSQRELSIKSLAVAPNGKWFAAGDSEGHLKIWSVGDRKEVHSKKIFSTGITQIAISPDGQEIAMISYDVNVAIYESSTLKKKNQFRIDSNGLKNISYVTPGQLAAAAETTTLWNTSTGKQEQILSPGRYQSSLARSTDGKWFAFGDKDDLQLWDVAQAKKTNKRFTNIAMNELVDFSPDGKSLVTANGSSIRLWDIETQRLVQVVDVVGWPIVGLSWLPDTNVILVTTANGWTRIWGTVKSGEPLGLRPMHAATALPDHSAKEPATTEQWLQAIDLRTFPRLSGDKPMIVESTRLMYAAHESLDQTKLFYDYYLKRAGWTESASPSSALSPGSVEYTKGGFMLTASFAGEGENKTNVGLHNIGNFDFRWLPKFDAAPIKLGYSSANVVMYETKADILQIETTLLKKLHEAGWTPYSRLHSSHNEVVDVRDMEFLRNGTVLRVSIRRFPADPTSFHIQQSVSSINHALPVPKDCGFIEFDGHTQPFLVATTSMTLEQTAEFYDKSMKSDGWLAHEARRSEKEEQIWLTFRRGQQDVLVGLSKQARGKTLIRVGDQLENASWQLEKPKPVADAKSVGASIEAADFPILNETKSATYDSNGKSIEVQMDGRSMTVVADRYSQAIQGLGWTIKGSGIRSDEYTFLTFTKEKVEVDLRARSMAGKIVVNIQGDGLIWTKPLPGGKKIVSYETWLRQNKHPASLDLLDAYQVEMQSIAARRPPP